jgi:hypothetical protein
MWQMRKALTIGLCLLAMADAQAKDLVVLDVGGDPSSEDLEKGRAYTAAQQAAAEIPASDARAFIKRLDDSVGRAMRSAGAGEMDGVKLRNQAIQLAKLQDEAERFGVLFAPYAKCREAAVDAGVSWQGLIGRNQRQLEEYYRSYQVKSAACQAAAK